MGKQVLIGASIPHGLQAAKDFYKLKMGRIVLVSLVDDVEENKAVMRFFREKKIYVLLSELLNRDDALTRYHGPDISKEEFDSIIAEAGEYYVGRHVLDESGGMLYWPKEYTIDAGEKAYNSLPHCFNRQEAHEAYVNYLKKRIKIEKDYGAGAFCNAESSIAFPYIAEAGFDNLILEMLPGDPILTLNSVRGTAKAYGLPWGVHIAAYWYGGWKMDTIWQQRWKISLYLSYLAGAEYIYPESGHYNYKGFRRGALPFNSPETRQVRKTLRDIHRFTLLHQRPEKGPLTPLGILHGQDDGQPGIWNPYVWGQYENGREWECGDAEAGMLLLRQLRRKEDVFRVALSGEHDFTGNPPEGQYDLVPAAADNFSDYHTLVLLGENRMDQKLYKKLINYVENGGRLLIYLPHFDISGERGKIELYNNGDISELCGVKITGHQKGDVRGIQFIRQSEVPGWEVPELPIDVDPMYIGYVENANIEFVDSSVKIVAGATDNVERTLESYSRTPMLLERKLGKGFVWLVPVFNFAGSGGLRSFSENLLRIISDGYASDLKICASDAVRYAVYPTEYGKIYYFLNTDPSLSSAVKLIGKAKISPELIIPPATMRIVYIKDDLMIAPENNFCRLSVGNKNKFQLITAKQNVLLCNFSKSTISGTLNQQNFELAGGANAELSIPSFVTTNNEREILDDDCWSEAEDFDVDCVKLPY